MLKFLILGFTVVWMALDVSGQDTKTVQIDFVPTFNGSTLIIETDEVENFTDTLRIETLRLYWTNLQLLKHSQTVFKSPTQHFLLDASDITKMQIKIEVPISLTFDELQFDLGVDSTTHEAGAMAGALDPMHGMYWTWQSGYINFKLEGVAPDCPARKHRFQYHLGGYRHPFSAVQEIKLPVFTEKNIRVGLAIDRIIDTVDLTKHYHIMSPGDQAVKMSSMVAQQFHIIE